MSLEGKTIVVGGGTGDVGEGIVAALIDRGAHVIVPARSEAKGGQLRDAVSAPERVEIFDAAPVDEASAARLAERLEAAGQIDGAIASLGSWFSFGKLIDTPQDGFEQAFQSLLLSHFLFAKAVVPTLAKGGTYIVVNGAGSEAPVPGSSAVSIHAHAVSMLFQTLVAEHPDLRSHMLMLRSIIATRARATADPAWVTAREVGDTAAWLFSAKGQLTAGSVIGLQSKRT